MLTDLKLPNWHCRDTQEEQLHNHYQSENQSVYPLNTDVYKIIVTNINIKCGILFRETSPSEQYEGINTCQAQQHTEVSHITISIKHGANNSDISDDQRNNYIYNKALIALKIASQKLKVEIWPGLCLSEEYRSLQSLTVAVTASPMHRTVTAAKHFVTTTAKTKTDDTIRSHRHVLRAS